MDVAVGHTQQSSNVMYLLVLYVRYRSEPQEVLGGPFLL